MNEQNSQTIDNKNSNGEFSRHWLLVLVCAVGIGVGVSSLPFYTQGLFIEAWISPTSAGQGRRPPLVF